jgi:hypothetical protein
MLVSPVSLYGDINSMPNKSGTITWEKIHEGWRVSNVNDGPPGVNIVDVAISSPSNKRAIRGPVIDSWPTSDIAKRKQALQEYGTFGATWETFKGFLHTGNMFASADDEEEVGAIWIGSSLWDFIHPFPEDWRGPTYRLMSDMFHAVRQCLEEKRQGQWHHAMTHALPSTLLDWEMAEVLRPQNVRHMLAIIRLNVIFVRSKWTLVRVLPADKPLRALD